MKAVEFHAVGDIRLDEVPEPTLEKPTDAIVRITASAICGTELHFARGTFSGMKAGTLLRHEAVGVVEQVGTSVNHRKYIPRPVEMVRSGSFDPAKILTQKEPLMSAIDAYKAFDLRRHGWIKVELLPQPVAAPSGTREIPEPAEVPQITSPKVPLREGKAVW